MQRHRRSPYVSMAAIAATAIVAAAAATAVMSMHDADVPPYAATGPPAAWPYHLLLLDTWPPGASAQQSGTPAPPSTPAFDDDEFNALLAATVVDVFGRTIDEFAEGATDMLFPDTGTPPQQLPVPGLGAGANTGSGSLINPSMFTQDAEITLYVPPKMIVDTQYEAMLFIDVPRAIDTPVALVTDGGTRLSVPPIVTIPAGDNHAIFPIRANDVIDHTALGGTRTSVRIVAIPPTGDRADASTDVFITPFQPSALRIAAPTGQTSGGFGASGGGGTVRTITGDVPIRVLLVDGAGGPVEAERDMTVHLTSSSSNVDFSGGIGNTPDLSLVIRRGQSSADAVVHVNGDATVYAAADGIESDWIIFDHDSRDIEVRMGVAPTPAVRTTIGYYYVWLEKGGSIYTPDETLDVRMSSSNPDRVRLTSDVGPGGDTHYGLMDNGIMRGIYYAVNRGTSVLSASVAGYGGASEEIEVMPAITGEPVLVDGTWHKLDVPDTMRLWVYPDVPSDLAWGVIGTYTTPFEPPLADDEDEDEDADDSTTSTGGSSASNSNNNRPPGSGFTVTSDTSGINTAVATGGGGSGSSPPVVVVTPVDPLPPAEHPDQDESGRYRTASGDRTKGCTESICPVHATVDTTVTITSDGGLRHAPLVKIGETIHGVGGPHDALPSSSVITGAVPGSPSRSDAPDHQSTQFPRSAVEFPIRAVTSGAHTVTISADGMASDTTDFESRPAYGYDGSAVVTAIPSRLNVPSEIAFVSITDGVGGGYIVNPGGTHRPQDARVIQTGSAIRDLSISGDWTGGTAVIHGTFASREAEVFVQVPGLHSTPAPMSVPGGRAGIETWMPTRVNVGEPFPVLIYTVDDNDAPVEVVRDSSSVHIASGDVVVTNDGADGSMRMTTLSHGIVQFNVVSDGMFAPADPVESFINTNEGDVSAQSQTDEEIALGDTIAIDLTTGGIGAPHVSITGTGGAGATPLVFAADPVRPGRYLATPSEAGTYHVVVRVAGEGWDTYEASYTYLVEEFVTASFTAIADDGVSVPSTLILTALTVQEDGTMSVPNGGTASVHPGIFEASIDGSIDVGGDRIYGLTGLESNGGALAVSERFTIPIQQDMMVRAVYQRNIDIDFAPIFDSEDPDVAVSVEGGGSYRYGETVLLEAVPAPEMYGLVWHMPDKWGGLPDDAVVSPDMMQVQFEALNTAVGSVEFRKDYSILTLLIVLGAAACGFVVWRKAPADTIYNIQDGLIGVGSKLSRVAARPKPKPGRSGRNRKKDRRKVDDDDDDGDDEGGGDGEGGGGGGGKGGSAGGGGDGGGDDGGDDGGDEKEGKKDGSKLPPPPKEKKGMMSGLRTLIKGEESV